MVSMLQFANHTLFFSDATMKNIIVIKCILRIFELTSSPKVNFSKSN